MSKRPEEKADDNPKPSKVQSIGEDYDFASMLKVFYGELCLLSCPQNNEIASACFLQVTICVVLESIWCSHVKCSHDDIYWMLNELQCPY